AAGQRTSGLPRSFLQPGKPLENPIQLVVRRVLGKTDAEIFVDRQFRKDMPALWNVTDAAARDVIGGEIFEQLSVGGYLSLGESGVSPMMVRSVVVLPTPLRPSRATDSPSSTLSESACRILLFP